MSAPTAMRLIADGSMTARRNVERMVWHGTKVDPNWSFVDLLDHPHTAADLRKTTWQPTEESWCEMCDTVHDFDDGPRLCVICAEPIIPRTITGEHHDFIDHGTLWSVEYVSVNSRLIWRERDDDPVFREILDAGAIEPFLDRLGDPDESEYWS